MRNHLQTVQTVFLRERHHFVLYVPNGKATHWHKVYSFIAVDQQTNKCYFKGFQQPHLPNHALGSVWLYHGRHPFSDRPQKGQKNGALLCSRANHTHSVWVQCAGMRFCAALCTRLCRAGLYICKDNNRPRFLTCLKTLQQFLTPCSPVLIPQTLDVAGIWVEWIYDQIYSCHRQSMI